MAIRTGKLAGRLAAEGRLEAYNDAWKAAIGDEITMNVASAAFVAGYTPGDWDRTFRVGREMGIEANSFNYLKLPSPTGLAAIEHLVRHSLYRWRFRGGRYVQLREDEYVYDR